jgi:hypothetical protein
MTAFTFDEGRISGARYYTAKPTFASSHRVIMINLEWVDMVEWCVNTFGATTDLGVWNPGQRWYVNNAKFWFREHEDAVMFTLRWS